MVFREECLMSKRPYLHFYNQRKNQATKDRIFDQFLI